MSGKTIKLSERLSAIAKYIEKGASVADIGTDHGHLPVYLAQNSLARSIYATDISAGSLKKALDTAAIYGVADKISFIVAPGLEGIYGAEADTIVLSGLGGETIAHILAAAPRLEYPYARFILQPQTKMGELCLWLRWNGFVIRDASLARDRGKFYIIILAMLRESAAIAADAADVASHNGGACGDADGDVGGDIGFDYSAEACFDAEMGLLRILARKNDPHFFDYLNTLITITRRAAEGISRSGSAEGNGMAKRLEALTLTLTKDWSCS